MERGKLTNKWKLTSRLKNDHEWTKKLSWEIANTMYLNQWDAAKAVQKGKCTVWKYQIKKETKIANQIPKFLP